jgi:methyl-accepting chemotaxis protein
MAFSDRSPADQSTGTPEIRNPTEPDIVPLVESGARDALISRYAKALPNLIKDASIDLITFSKQPGVVIGRVHAPSAYGDNVTSRRKMIAEAMQTGKSVIGIEPAHSGLLTTFATVPIVSAKGVIGTIDVGTQLTNAFFERLKKAYNVDVAIQMDHDGQFKTQNATFQAKTFLTPAETKAAADDQDVQKTVDQDGRSLAVAARPLTDFSGHKIGVIEFVVDVTPIIQRGEATLWAIIASSAVIAILSLVLFIGFAFSLVRPIRKLTLAMNSLASGDLATEIEGQGRPDEIGAMAAAVQVFKDNALALETATADRQRMEAAAEADRNRNEVERQRLAREQENVVQALASGLARLSEGDLTLQIDAAFAAVYHKLKDDFNSAVARLRKTMTVIAETTQEIKSGTGEITQASDDLSRRTEQQAASLEETAAALDEITATVRKSAEGATYARQVVATADEDAKKSAAVVRQAIEAMDAIAKSAQQISQIIGVIDEIAFQTNLLALNAGVEAARAGDAGRGFAVVASEVRALAQRSAEAAKEIKQLISTSTTEVDHGVALVAETGKALERIMMQVTEINTVVAQIATGASEQATGLAEINTAINQMDQVTQKNAAMVEESTAASHSLAHETEQLSSLVGQFRIGEQRDNTAMRKQLQKVAPHAFRQPARTAPRSQPEPRPLRVANAPAGQDNNWEEF